jgi:hypothetical protein
MATMQLWQEQQLPLRQQQRHLCTNGNNTIMKRAMMPAWGRATRATTLAQWWQRHLHVAVLLQGQQRHLNVQWTTWVYFFSWLDRLFEQNHFIPTFPTGKRRSGRRQLYWFQHGAKQSCTPLDWLGGSSLTSRRGKIHIGNFGLPTNLKLFFLGHFFILGCVPHFFLAENEYLGLGVKKLNSPPILGGSVAFLQAPPQLAKDKTALTAALGIQPPTNVGSNCGRGRALTTLSPFTSTSTAFTSVVVAAATYLFSLLPSWLPP